MFSKIGNMLKVNPSAQDGGRKDGKPQKDNGQAKDTAHVSVEGGGAGDSVVLSLEVLTVLAVEQKLSQPQQQEVANGLRRLASHGLFSIPVQPGSTALEAVRAALSYLSSARE